MRNGADYLAAEQQRREQVRLQAAGAVRPWRRDQRDRPRLAGRRRVGAAVAPGLAGGRGQGAAVQGAGVAGAAEPAAVEPLEAELRKGPLAHGFASDQRWTLGRGSRR